MHPLLYDRAIQWIPQKARVLDLGTGTGEFLDRLVREKGVQGEGVEKNAESLAECIDKGLIVHQGDVLDGLDQYEDASFDFALLLGTFQELQNPHLVLQEAFRVARHILVAFHSFSYWEVRWKLLITGRVPMTRSMPHKWYSSPNLNYSSLLDFHAMCEDFHFHEEKYAYFSQRGEVKFQPNFFAEQVLILLTRPTRR